MSKFSEPVSLNWAEPAPRKRAWLPLAALGVAGFALCALGTVGYGHWRAQQTRIAQLAGQLADRQVAVSAPASEPTEGSPGTVRYAPTADLLPQSPAEPAALVLTERGAARPATDDGWLPRAATAVGAVFGPEGPGATPVSATRYQPTGVPEISRARGDLAVSRLLGAQVAGYSVPPDGQITLTDRARVTERSTSDALMVLTREGFAAEDDPTAATDAPAATLPVEAADDLALTDIVATSSNGPLSDASAAAPEVPDAPVTFVPAPATQDGPAQRQAAEPLQAPPPVQGTVPLAPTSPAAQLRLLANRVVAPEFVDELAQEHARATVVGDVIGGVADLVAVVAEGNFSIEVDELPNGQLCPHLVIDGREADQAAIQNLLVRAAEQDLISVPSHVQSSSGVIHEETLLLAVVQRALSNGTPAERAAAARLTAEIQMMTGNNLPGRPAGGEHITYVVERGDSLAYIALQFYGDTNAYLSIFDANRDQLDSPEMIQTGQVLLIPDS